MGKLHDRMLQYMELRGYSHHTINMYLGHMVRFVRHLGRSPDTAGSEEIRSYLHYLIKERALAQGTIGQAYCALRLFYETILDRTWDEKHIPRTRHQRRLPAVLSPTEIEAIFSSLRNLKHRALLMTIYSGGLRCMEALQLQVSDIDSDRMLIQVRQGKGNRDRYTLLSKRALMALRKYWLHYRPESWLFPGRKPGTHLATCSARLMFKQALDRSGVTKSASLHTLRHSFATHLLESGTNLYHIQRLLGHARTRSTAVYLHVASTDLARIVSPMDRVQDAASPTTKPPPT